MSFQQIKHKYELSNQEHFRYLEIRDFYDKEIKQPVKGNDQDDKWNNIIQRNTKIISTISNLMEKTHLTYKSENRKRTGFKHF